MKESKRKINSSDALDFKKNREDLHDKMLKYSNLGIKRFLNLDNEAYKDGALKQKHKELMGLLASLVLRCEECMIYHLYNCYEYGVTEDELTETLNIALIIGGSIIIPHIRKLYDQWDKLEKENE